MRFSTADLAARLGGRLSGPGVDVEGASIDSRATKPGQLFVPIVADRDGHEFVAEALQAGASAYLTSQAPLGGTAIEVDDTRQALTRLGQVARSRLVGGVVGITGSVGKTTTKDLVAQCLSSTFVTAASERSLNNELGVPLTLANAPDAAQWVVLEMGARGPGHVAQLVDLAEPSVGVVTRVAMAHTEFFGSLKGVYLAKRELVDGLPASGVAVLNADDPWVQRMAEGCPCPVLGYGLDTAADVRAEGVQFNQDLQPRFRLVTPWGAEDTSLQLHGSVQVSNALAAAATALWCGASLPDVAAALSVAVGPALRMDVRRPNVGPVLIVDCYNANPASTEAALRALSQLGPGHKVALLGVMAELGIDSAAEHARMAEVARSLDIAVLGFQTDGYGGDVVSSVSDAVARLAELGANDAVLIKGSRVARLEDVVQAYGQSIGDGSFA